MTRTDISGVLTDTDWTLLAQQKLQLVLVIDDLEKRCDAAMTDGRAGEREVLSTWMEALSGILYWMDALQDAAQAEGHPTVFLIDPEEEDVP
ncbi:hypothetical protein [Deinococcus sp. DB0503]|uniref:hypothetical protein n=1 Tax=Deinococcus sp. DB0503 TaxID=2479203 RepID=UPI0018DF57A6|nr:hypothetical protein [Deinococcus sp. DB0503]MBI0446879.1 hypothetical protein [Deinococcus sp. DB0503]